MRMPQTTTPTIAEALASLAARECRMAMRALADAKRRHRGVHEARKAIRRLKSLLALAAEPFAESLPSIDATLGRLATGLSPLRDAYVAVNMARTVAGPAPSPEWQHAIDALEHRSEGRLATVLAKDPRFLKRRRELRDLAGVIEALPWQEVDRDTVERAIARTERRVAKAQKRASHKPSPVNLHRWRRRARRLRMQLDAWRKALKATGKSSHHHARQSKAAANAMSKLSDALGAKQDLRALRTALRSLHEPQAVAPLLEQIRQELTNHRKIG
ncbi:CHAD domain-containing protein [Luteibacter jiangsuensis]|uniref:CHAD domain-containing protein n=2 Tax=Luteibacter jiangsuensis TaxID=637577 RepID=A0ABT9SST8_9GAMM|nr:CHAD domain-containing protein [Luteibacter jiangsuensis]